MTLDNLFQKIDSSQILSQDEVVLMLKSQGVDLDHIYQQADSLRRENVGDEIFLRGIIEFSNYCQRDCYYCGIRHSIKDLHRYRMSKEEILEVCKNMEKSGQTTVVLQSGEDFFYTKEVLADIISSIKKNTSLAVTLSVGEREKEIYEYWYKNGMDRYLLRFETSSPALFKCCHPDSDLDKRVKCLKDLQSIGVQTGSGFLIGVPGETIEDLADDILFCTDLDLDMIGVGPFISHPDTPFAKQNNPFEKEIYFKTVAILRLLNKKAHIPSTTAFDAISAGGRNKLLTIGANVFMPNATPKKYRKYYQLYPGKPCVDESADDCSLCTASRIKSLNRNIGLGPGHSFKKPLIRE